MYTKRKNAELELGARRELGLVKRSWCMARGIPRAIRLFAREGVDARGRTIALIERFKGPTLAAARFRHEGDAAIAARAVLSALAFMHQRGWVHCDVAPENIAFRRASDVRSGVVVRPRNVVLFDFDRARRIERCGSARAMVGRWRYAGVSHTREDEARPVDDLQATLFAILDRTADVRLPWPAEEDLDLQDDPEGRADLASCKERFIASAMPSRFRDMVLV